MIAGVRRPTNEPAYPAPAAMTSSGPPGSAITPRLVATNAAATSWGISISRAMNRVIDVAPSATTTSRTRGRGTGSEVRSVITAPNAANTATANTAASGRGSAPSTKASRYMAAIVATTAAPRR